MKKIKYFIDKVLKIVCTSILALMVLIAIWQVIARYFLNKPSTSSEELLIYGFVWSALLGAAYVFGKREHMAMTFIVDKLGVKQNQRTKIIGEACILVFSIGVLIYGGLGISNLAMGQISPALDIPMGYIYGVLPISGLLIVIYSIINLTELITLNKNEEKIETKK